MAIFYYIIVATIAKNSANIYESKIVSLSFTKNHLIECDGYGNMT